MSSSKFDTDDPQISGATLQNVCIFFVDLAPGICPSLSGGRVGGSGHSSNNPVIRLIGHDFALRLRA